MEVSDKLYLSTANLMKNFASLYCTYILLPSKFLDFDKNFVSTRISAKYYACEYISRASDSDERAFF